MKAVTKQLSKNGPAGPGKRRALRSGVPERPSFANPLYLQNLLSDNVRLVRLARGLSQEALADEAALDRTYVSSVERRLRNISIQNIQRLALALSVDPRDLLDPALGQDSRFVE